MTNLFEHYLLDPALEARLNMLRGAALELAGATDDLLDALATSSAEDTAWLLPLVVASVEVEYCVRHRDRVDARDVAAACAEVSDLLTRSPRGDADFASRYASARATSSLTALLHKRAIAACRNLELRVSWADGTLHH